VHLVRASALGRCLTLVSEPNPSEVQERFFSYRCKPYQFISDEAKMRFLAGTNRKSGDLILWDVVNGLKTLGVDIESELSPRSRYTPDMLREPLKRYEAGGRMGEYDKQAFSQAFNRVRRMFKVKGPRLKAIAIELTDYDGSKNSGAPYFQKKDEVAQQALNEAYAIRRGKAAPPMTIFHRGKNETEARPVFGYPFAMTRMESRFFAPYQEAILSSPWCPYMGGKYKHQIAGMINEVRSKAHWIEEFDFSGLDGSASSFLISKAFQVIEENFEMDDFDRHDWDIIVRYQLFGPILAPDGMIYFGSDHGVKSGSDFTQLIDTIITMFAIFYCAYKRSTKTSNRTILQVVRVIGLGDDSWLGTYGEKPDLGEIASAMGELGLVLNAVKSKIKTPRDAPHFLGHEWNKFVSSRDVQETLIRLACPERNRLEYWAKDDNPTVYIDALIERIERYQEDNHDAWWILQKLKQVLKYPELGSLPIMDSSNEVIFFKPIKERIEMERYRKLPHTAYEPSKPPGAYRAVNAWY